MSEYEFTGAEDKKFTEFSFSLFLLSISLGVAGFVIVILGLVSPLNITDIITGLAFIAIAVSLFLPVQNFKNIVSTEGSDMKELMNGFSVLSQGFTFVLGATIFLQLMILIGYIQNI
ncbi:MAG: hypothetical protein GPJ54_09725 [Candidatus Heimdallarchaeota archaeon]|nr:hypothetical protein [Candidatus Heimdallarchaeota archaeon]